MGSIAQRMDHPDRTKEQQNAGICGGTYQHNGGVTVCPAYQKESRNYDKLGHFKSVCRSKPKARPREQESEKTVMTPDEYLGELSFSDDENAFYLSINSVHDTNTKNPALKGGIRDLE